MTRKRSRVADGPSQGVSGVFLRGAPEPSAPTLGLDAAAASPPGRAQHAPPSTLGGPCGAEAGDVRPVAGGVVAGAPGPAVVGPRKSWSPEGKSVGNSGYFAELGMAHAHRPWGQNNGPPS